MGGSIQLLIRRIDFLVVMRTVDSNALDDIGQWAKKNGPPPRDAHVSMTTHFRGMRFFLFLTY